MTEDKTSSSTHLEPAPSLCRWAGAACTHQSASRCLGGRTASGSCRQTTTVHHSVGHFFWAGSHDWCVDSNTEQPRNVSDTHLASDRNRIFNSEGKSSLQVLTATGVLSRCSVPLNTSPKLPWQPAGSTATRETGAERDIVTMIWTVSCSGISDLQEKQVTFPNSSPSTTSSWFRIHFLSCRKKTINLFFRFRLVFPVVTEGFCIYTVVTLTTGLSRTTPDFFVMTCLEEKWCSMSWGMVVKPVPSKRYWPYEKKQF